MGRKLYDSEIYILSLVHMLKLHNSPPWEWDYEYPEEMYGRYYPEDYHCLVQIDMLQHKADKDKKGQ